MEGALPFDSKSSHPRFLSENISSDSFNDRFCWWLRVEFLAIVLVVHVVSHTDEFTVVIGAGEEYDRDTKDFRRGYFLQVRWIGFEDEFVDTDRDGAD